MFYFGYFELDIVYDDEDDDDGDNSKKKRYML